MAREQIEAPTTCGGGGEQERGEGEDEPRKSEDDSEHVIQHQHTSDGRAAISADSIGDHSSKSVTQSASSSSAAHTDICLPDWVSR